MRHAICCLALLGLLLMVSQASAADYDVTTQHDVVYAEHDGTKLVGDLYLPKGLAKAPALVAIHGGGWQIGSRAFYNYWGPFLARHGYAVFAIEYRLGKPGVYPAAVYDAKAAI
jgi:acetyl esterase/lipase